MVYVISRTGDTDEPLDVKIRSVEYRGGRYQTLKPLITIPAGQSEVEHRVETEDDDLDSEDVYITVFLQDHDGDVRMPYRLTGLTLFDVLILDNDPTEVTIGPARNRYTRTEGQDVEFTLRRHGAVIDPLTVNVTVAQSGGPFVAGTVPATVLFAGNSATATLTVGTDNDGAVESHGKVTAAIADGAGYRAGNPGSAQVVVFDDESLDANTPVLSIASQKPWVEEGQQVVFFINRQGPTDSELTVYVDVLVRVSRTTHNCGSAHKDRDDTCTTTEPREVTFPAGAETTSIVYQTVNESVNDGNSSVKARFDLGQYTFLSGSREAEVWVRDDDIPTVTIEPEYEERVEDGSSSNFILRRTGDASIGLGVRFQGYSLNWWPGMTLVHHGEILVDGVRYSHSWNFGYPRVFVVPAGSEGNFLVPRPANQSPGIDEYTKFIGPGESSSTSSMGTPYVGPMGGLRYYVLLPFHCETVWGHCGYLPQYHIGTPSTAKWTLLNDAQGVWVEADLESVTEGDTVTFALHRFGSTPGAKEEPLTVRVQVTQDGEFIEGIPPPTVTFAGFSSGSSGNYHPSELTKTLSVPTTNDLRDEADGAITLTILPAESTGANENTYEVVHLEGSPWTGAATVVVTDDDDSELAVSDARARENDGSIEFTVTLGAALDRRVTVDWATVPSAVASPAAPGTDYVAASGALTFEPGDTSRPIVVTLLNDPLYEETETFTVQLSNPSGALVDDGSGTGTITDSDSEQTVYLRAIAQDEIAEGQDAVFLADRCAWVNSFLCDRDSVTGSLTVNMTVTQEGDFISGATPTTLFFPAGVATAVVGIPTTDDDLREADGSVTVTLKDGTGYNISDASRTIDVLDDDRVISIADAEGIEGDGSILFTVSLTEAAVKKVTVEVATVDGRATSHDAPTDYSRDQDFVAKSARLIFRPGEITKDFRVSVSDDRIDETTETFTVELSNPSSNARIIDATATGTINDDDERMQVLLYGPSQHRKDEDRNTPIRFNLELEHPETLASERNTVVYWKVTPGTATPGADYWETGGRTVIPVGGVTRANAF